jgi:hypothetical protein
VYNGKLAAQFYEERTRDLLMHERWPTCWPRSRYVLLLMPGSRVPHYAYVQRRMLPPFTNSGFDPSMIKEKDYYAHWHAANIAELIAHNTDVRQFAYSVPMAFTIHHPGGVIEQTPMRSWLMPIDYR